MRKKIIFIILLLTLVISGFAQEVRLKVIEKKGVVDIKSRDGEWIETSLNDIIPYGIEIFTGFHSSISIEVGNESYITVNQLTRVKIETVLARKKEAIISLSLISGYLVILSKSTGEYKNKIFISLNKGTVEFNDSGGEVYSRQDKGTIIKSFSGKIKIGSKLSKVYFIRKGEVCGISPDGKLVESDYYLRKKINAKPNDVISPQQIIGYYDLFFQPYTSDIGTK